MECSPTRSLRAATLVLLLASLLHAACVGSPAGESGDRAPQAPPARVHQLAATPATVAWGYYWAEAEPVLRIEPGDIVEVETLLTSSPTRLEGAEPGDTLEVRVLSIDLAIPYAYNGCSGFIRENCDEQRMRIIRFDEKRMVAPFSAGIEIPLRPFFGSMGVAPPPAAGRISSNPPWIHAGNLDNKELVAGTTLFIPVHVPGALFEVGDGHAAQGDGEVDQTAIETSLDGSLQFFLHKGARLAWPRAETPTHFITMGMDENLTEATRIAVQEMVDFLMQTRSLERGAAYALASIAADLHITQLVDGNVDVHMMIAKEIFPEAR